MQPLTMIKVVVPQPAEEIKKIASIHRCTQRMVYYALRGDSTSDKAIRIRVTALRRGNCVDTNIYSDGTKKKSPLL